MRKFIISDIHGFGNLYYSVMNYLDNLSFANSLLNNDLIGFVSGRSGATGLNRKYSHTIEKSKVH